MAKETRDTKPAKPKASNSAFRKFQAMAEKIVRAPRGQVKTDKEHPK